ncbi:MAG TPA: cell surface protein SprA, partial [bacterium]|nr:cell surface protein SprA [bacterium]
HKGLFGIRSEAQFGPIEITTIASQEKGESNTKSFKGKAEESTTEIKDYEYKSNTYFFLDFVYRDNFKTYRDSFDRIFYDPADSLKVIDVYINDSIESNDTKEGTFAYPGIAYPMNMYTGEENRDAYVEGYYHLMDPREYYVNRELGFIQFQSRIPDEWTVGVYMVTQDGREFGSLEYEAKDPDSQNIFKLIKRKGQRPTNTDTWDLEWKNVYDLGQRNIDLDGLEIRIFKQATDGVSRDKQDGIPYIQILGIDKVDEEGNENPDNKVDFNRGFVDRYRGELIFPILRPFDPEDKPAGVTVELNKDDRVPEIYDVYNLQEKQESTKYYIEIKTANRQATIKVGGGLGGILENSEGVFLDGRKLARGTDYRINYNSGEITLLNEDALSPNADIKINYQEANIFQEMQKSLFGIRGEYNLFSESRIGAVFLFNNESTKEKRVRLGNEPSRTTLFDIDADFNFQSRFLTSAVDFLPLVVADKPSNIRIQGEYAYSMPNMNTHNEVSIDDYEGSQNTPMSIIRTNWTTASKPDESTTVGMDLRKRGNLQWYNPYDRIKSERIWPNKETSAGENTVHVLNLAYGKAEDVPADSSYAGVMSSFWGSGIDLSRARFIEVWAREISKGNPNDKTKLLIDIGSISEDFFPLEGRGDNYESELDTEDKPIPGQGHGDGVLVAEEDTGLDGLFDKQEPDPENPQYSAENRDPNGDNWGYNPDKKNDYSRINGTEGNSRDSDRAGVPDTEDINHNGILDTRNTYYEYTVTFDSSDPYLVEDSVNEFGWRLFRIPLWNNLRAINDGTKNIDGYPDGPDSTLIEFARLWVTNTDSTMIQIASMEIVESNWIELGIFDSEDINITEDDKEEIFRISTKNTHENLDYTSPPGISGELDRDTKIRRKEQSLVIEFEKLNAEHSGFIYRNFSKMDFTDYTRLKMYVHGPDDFPVSSSGKSDYELIIRFGGDKDNYYEYRTPVYQGWAIENMVDIDFEKCTQFKLFLEDKIEQAYTFGDSLKKAWSDSLTENFADGLITSFGDSLGKEILDLMIATEIKKADAMAKTLAESLADT